LGPKKYSDFLFIGIFESWWLNQNLSNYYKIKQIFPRLHEKISVFALFEKKKQRDSDQDVSMSKGLRRSVISRPDAVKIPAPIMLAMTMLMAGKEAKLSWWNIFLFFPLQINARSRLTFIYSPRRLQDTKI
jgi:hypothetical protein